MPPRSLQLSALAVDPTRLCQSPALSDQVSNDLLEAVQQPKAISQRNKGPPTAWSGPECNHSSQGGGGKALAKPFMARERDL